MEFDWLDLNFDLKKVSPREIEESFEDPFALKLLPDTYGDEEGSRYFLLGKSINGLVILSLFWTDGKKFRVISARAATENEASFYERKSADAI